MGRWRLRLFWALVLGAVAALGTNAYLQSLHETAPVVIAAGDIPARAEITADLLKVVEVSRSARDALAAGGFDTPAAVIGRYARQPIAKGSILRDDPAWLTAPGEVQSGPAGQGAMADFLPGGTRAVSVLVDRQAVVGRHIQTGNLVDIIFTSTTEATGGVYAGLVLQQIEVLDITAGGDGDSRLLVTLLLTPAQAVELTLAKRTGSIDLALVAADPGEPISLPPLSPLRFAAQTEVSPDGSP